MKTHHPISRSVYANLTNDYMFKRVFGSEESKDILITFLNHIVGNGEISDVTFQNTEHLGPTEEDRKAVFDIFVRTRSGDEYIVEMQLAQQKYFRERALFYTGYPIINQAALAREKYREEHGGVSGFRWDFMLKPVRFIAVVNFGLGHSEGWDAGRYHSSYRLHEDDTGELLHDKLQFIFLELARFNKREDELEGYYDKWMYLLKNMSHLESRPKVFDEKEFDRLFEMAELCTFTAEEYRNYQNSQNMLYDYENTIDFAREQGEVKGREEGREEEKVKIAKKMKADGIDVTVITKYTGLTEEQLKSI